MSKFFFGAKKATTAAKDEKSSVNDDTCSLNSDDHSSTLSSETSKQAGKLSNLWNATFKRNAVAESPVAKVYIEATIDDLMKNLYIDTDELEHYCRTGASIGSKNVSAFATGSLRDGYEGGEITTRKSISSSLGIKKTAELVIESLPVGYFSPNFDPVLQQLHEVTNWEGTQRYSNLLYQLILQLNVLISMLKKNDNSNNLEYIRNHNLMYLLPHLHSYVIQVS